MNLRKENAAEWVTKCTEGKKAASALREKLEWSEMGGGSSLLCSDLEKVAANFVVPPGQLLLLMDTSDMG